MTDGRELALREGTSLLAMERPERGKVLDALELLDLHGTEDDLPIDAALSDLLWRMSQAAETVSKLDQAYLIYRLRQKVRAKVYIDGQLREAEVERWVTWESDLAQRVQQKPIYEWGKFCRMRLNIGPEVASQRKRIWEVYAVTCGVERHMLERAGISKLAQAVGQVARDWRQGGIDNELWMLLFGETYGECGEPYTHARDEAEAHGDDMETFPEPDAYHIPPATHAEVTAHVANRSAETEAPERRQTVYDFQIEETPEGNGRQVVCWVRRPSDPVAVPVAFAKIVPVEDAQLLTPEEMADAWDAFRRVIR